MWTKSAFAEGNLHPSNINVNNCEAKTENMCQFAHVGRIASDASSYLLRGRFPLRRVQEQEDAITHVF